MIKLDNEAKIFCPYCPRQLCPDEIIENLAALTTKLEATIDEDLSMTYLILQLKTHSHWS